MREDDPERAGGNRFERAWAEWDDKLEDGKEPPELLAELPSEKILQLLAGAGKERRYERDLLATEAMNRLGRARRGLDEAADEVAELVKDVEAKGEKVRENVHDTEEVVARLQGSEKLGGNTPQEITAHHASILVENLMDMLGRADSALERLEDARRKDVQRALGGEEDEDPGRSGR